MTMNLQNMNHADLRHLLGNMTFNSGVLAIDGTNTENVQTGATIEFTVKGIHYTKAAVAEIDLSTLTGLPSTALADGYTQMFGLELVAGGTISVVYGEQIATADITSGDQVVDWPIASDGLSTVFGAIKVANASGSDWTLGTTDLDAAGITDTYYNICRSSY